MDSCTDLMLQCLSDGVVPAVIEIDLASLHGHGTASSYLRAELDGVIHQLLPAKT